MLLPELEIPLQVNSHSTSGRTLEKLRVGVSDPSQTAGQVFDTLTRMQRVSNCRPLGRRAEHWYACGRSLAAAWGSMHGCSVALKFKRDSVTFDLMAAFP